MDIPTIPGAWYTVATATTCEITDTATGTPLGTANAGSYSFQAQGSLTTLSDDSALYSKANFKSAPAALMALGLLGGGSSTGSGSVLPAGYLAAEFLESNGTTAVIDSQIVPNWETGLHVKMQALTTGTSYYLGTQSNAGLPSIWVFDATGVLRVKYNQALFDINELRLNVFEVKINWLNSKTLETELGSRALPQTGESPWLYNLTFFRATYKSNTTYDNGKQARFYYIKMSQGDDIVRDMIPCISPAGEGCMYDMATKRPFENASNGAFIVGLTLAQALKLADLPATGGTLTVSLPTGYDSDAGVMSALETARANGWTLTIQTYTPEAAAASATFSLRRIWVRRTQSENGLHVAADGTRWQVDWCVDMLTPDGSTPDAYGYELFRSQEAAVAFWELTPYVDPESENLLTEHTANE